MIHLHEECYREQCYTCTHLEKRDEKKGECSTCIHSIDLDCRYERMLDPLNTEIVVIDGIRYIRIPDAVEGFDAGMKLTTYVYEGSSKSNSIEFEKDSEK